MLRVFKVFSVDEKKKFSFECIVWLGAVGMGTEHSHRAYMSDHEKYIDIHVPPSTPELNQYVYVLRGFCMQRDEAESTVAFHIYKYKYVCVCNILYHRI